MKLLNLNDCGIRLSKGLLWRGKKENKEELNQWYIEVIDDLVSLPVRRNAVKAGAGEGRE